MFVYESFRTCRKPDFTLVTDVHTISECRTCIGWPKTCVNTPFYCKQRIGYRRHKIVGKVVKTFNQDVSTMICYYEFHTTTPLIVNSIE